MTQSTHGITKARKIVLKGKYLKVLEDFAAKLKSSAGFAWPSGEFDALVNAIARLHGDFLTTKDAAELVINECFAQLNEYKSRDGHLTDPGGVEFVGGMIGRLKSYIESLPRTYLLRVQLPSFPAEEYGQTTLSLSEQVRFIIGGSGPLFDQQNASMILGAPLIYVGATSYLEFEVKGYADWSLDSPAMATAISLAKQCSFLLTSFGALHHGLRSAIPAATLTVVDPAATQTIRLPHSLALCFGDLVPTSGPMIYDSRRVGGVPGVTLLGDGGRPAATPIERTEALKCEMDAAVRFLGMQAHKDYPSLAAAMEWHQDSRFAENQTVGYLAACIGLEAVLGSEDHMEGMTNRLADRYAFLLGKGRAMRESLVKEYKEVLFIRGKLVHAKAARLDPEHRPLLLRAQSMLRDVIKHELLEMYRS